MRLVFPISNNSRRWIKSIDSTYFPYDEHKGQFILGVEHDAHEDDIEDVVNSAIRKFGARVV